MRIYRDIITADNKDDYLRQITKAEYSELTKMVKTGVDKMEFNLELQVAFEKVIVASQVCPMSDKITADFRIFRHLSHKIILEQRSSYILNYTVRKLDIDDVLSTDGTPKSYQFFVDKNVLGKLFLAFNDDSDKQVMSHLCDIFTKVSDGNYDLTKLIVSKMCDVLQETESESNKNTLLYASKIISQIAEGSVEQKQTVVNSGILEIIYRLIQNSNTSKDIIKQANQVLENVAAGDYKQLKVVFTIIYDLLKRYTVDFDESIVVPEEACQLDNAPSPKRRLTGSFSKKTKICPPTYKY